MHDPAYLARLSDICRAHDVLLIADEIMTGFGRTGTLFAWEQSGAPAPDFLCLSKGITGGTLPLSVVLASDAVYDAFYDESVARGFLHSHSYTGNPLACAAALAVLDALQDDDVIATNIERGARWSALLAPMARHPRVRDFRHRGMIWAFDVDTGDRAFARHAFARGLAHGVLLRPIDRTVYLMPPYTSSDEAIAAFVGATLAILNEA
jgi:adenosylmethionine-8-amino-7-oxononanoate aminotransferase